MAYTYYIGVDNGTSGSIGIVSNDSEFKPIFVPTPTFKEQSYTKKKANISRIDTVALESLLSPFKDDCFTLIERPLVNPGRFKATLSGIRALEATLIIIEHLKIPYMYIDSKEWQKAMLPSGFKGPELKTVSCDISCRLFPHLSEQIKKQKDGDSILIAEYGRRQNF